MNEKSTQTKGSFLLHPFFEQPSRYGKGHAGNDGHGPGLSPDNGCRHVFQENSADNGHEVAQGVGIGDGLQPVRHVLDGTGETGKNGGRDQKHEGAEHCLLLGHGQGGDEQADPDDGQQEDTHAGKQQGKGAVEGYLQ